MKPCGALVFAVVLACCAAAQQKPVKISDLGWLAGCWETRKPDTGFILSEQWMKPEGGMMIGMGRTVNGGRAVDWEFMRIEQRGDGLAFVAKPKANKDETTFSMIRMSESEVVFENPTHDFPQRVSYRLAPADSLVPRIEGTVGGKLKSIEFPMQRTQCR